MDAMWNGPWIQSVHQFIFSSFARRRGQILQEGLEWPQICMGGLSGYDCRRDAAARPNEAMINHRGD